MAKKEAVVEEKGQGRAVTLPNGQKRVDYIREQYAKGVSRSDIKNNINEMLVKAGREDEQIPYQIVFAATKPKKDTETKATTNATKTAGKPTGKAKA